jgi:hypothetical protein
LPTNDFILRIEIFLPILYSKNKNDKNWENVGEIPFTHLNFEMV